MRKSVLVVLLLTSAGLFHSCSTGKKSIGETRTLPELKVKPENEAGPYRASVTKQHEILHTGLDLRPDWGKRRMEGTATITLRPWFKSSERVNLDARGMIIASVELLYNKDTVPARYVYKNDTIQVTTPSFGATDTFGLRIRYTACPEELKALGGSSAISSDKGLYFINADGKEPGKPRQLWTQGETQSNSVWFPTIDVPNQKMRQDIRITVDSSLKTLSNGLLISSKTNGDGTRTDHWKQDKPHAPYLAMLAVGPFSVIHDRWRSLDVDYYVEPAYEPVARRIFGNTPEMLSFFSKQLGVDYPWEKYHQVVVRDFVSGAMENTSATLHGEFLQRDARELIDGSGEDVIAHELYHHWFGDLVTCESWSNLPLNESFATYGEYLWNEYKYGREMADIGLQSDLNGYLREARNKQVDLIRFHYEDREDMFDRHSYAKGGTILHYLRKCIGDQAFFESLKRYLNDNRFQPAEVHQLRIAFEAVTGEDMNWFFNAWFLDKGHPEVEFSYGWTDSSQTAVLRVQQKQNMQSTPLYTLPLDVDLYFADGRTKRERILVTEREQVFRFACTTKPILINADAEKCLPAIKTDLHSNEEWVALYRKGPLYQDRFDALSALTKNLKAGDIEAPIVLDALKDPNWRIRILAIEHTDVFVGTDKNEEAKKMLFKLASRDSLPEVRETAVEMLSKHFSGDEMASFFSNVANDSSFRVCEAGLEALAKIDTAGALKLCALKEIDTHRRMFGIIAGIYASVGSDRNAGYMLKAFEQSSGNSRFSMLQKYGRFVRRCNDDAHVLSALKAVQPSSTAPGWMVRMGAFQFFKEAGESATEKAEAMRKEGRTNEATRWDEIAKASSKYREEMRAAESNPRLQRMFQTTL
ncbi:MAG: M1 family aminopeptidase [Bacteroidota bacterium]|jgi:aminopeptidase N